ncbi:glycoside hydrolase family 16 protein [Pararhodospirillum oryzae]|uniref:GH16 domain-containing protein n=1 Tax=Pararhodospirillum oryzae TaxID=478448 RepID=A0A512H3T3_9PROT|nr:glycoside hydrolase family 16 protein [Pararhodospirillum oryzae]GEO80124.1 hypothetical protein ROR02_02550 [Pararhodospirillum oryzae]
MRAITAAAVMVWFFSPDAWAGVDTCPPVQPASARSLTFESDFAKSGTIDSTQWRAYVGQHGPLSHELQFYVPDELSVTPGYGLRIKTDRRNVIGHAYTSGQIMSQGLFSQTYGRFEILAKLPQANGLWPAFWLMPENGEWPPEIDIYEYIYAPWGNNRNGESYPQTTFHWKDNLGKHSFIAPSIGSDIPLYRTDVSWDKTPPPEGYDESYTGFHVYSVDWRPGSLVYQIDNKTVFCTADDPLKGLKIPAMPMYMIINTAISGGTMEKPGWAGYLENNQSFPLYHDVAYVRAYQYTDLPASPSLPFAVQNIRLSKSNPKPGETLAITAEVKVGASGLGNGNVTFGLYSYGNVNDYHGRKEDVAKLSLNIPTLERGKTYTIKGNLTIPPSVEPGYHGLWIWATYATGPGNGTLTSKRLFNSPFAQYITVKPK